MMNITKEDLLQGCSLPASVYVRRDGRNKGYGSYNHNEREDVTAFFSEAPSRLPIPDDRALQIERGIQENRLPNTLESVSFGLAHEVAHLTQSDTCCMEGLNDVNRFLNPKAKSLFQQLTSCAFTRLCIFFVVCSFWTNFYIGTAVTQLGDCRIIPLDEASEYGQSLTLFMTGAVVAIPFMGESDILTLIQLFQRFWVIEGLCVCVFTRIAVA